MSISDNKHRRREHNITFGVDNEVMEWLQSKREIMDIMKCDDRLQPLAHVVRDIIVERMEREKNASTQTG